ncbi:DUF736 domain-containing protein [Rhizobium panacihumi]|uniref:DUF736 domain-containing protein n=1 Tax=Rhizobium panacihumi TaxID=2008450 RepID=UPI003D79DACC
MTDTLANFIQIDGTKITGNIATLSFDIDVAGEPVNSDNEKAPKYRLFARSPKGKNVEVGGIWERLNADDKPYLALTLNTGHSRWYANLGRYPGQDDDTILAVIPNDYLNSDRRS